MAQPTKAAYDHLVANPQLWRDYKAKYGSLPDTVKPPAAPAAAEEFLANNPDSAPDFEEKYGYVPSAPVVPPVTIDDATLASPVPQDDSSSEPGVAGNLLQRAKLAAARVPEGVAGFARQGLDKIEDFSKEVAGIQPGSDVDKAFQELSPFKLPKQAAVAVEDKSKEWGAQAVEAMSPEVRASLEKAIVDRDINGNLQFGEGARDPWTWTGLVLDTGATMIPGVGVTTTAARAAYATRYGQALAQTATRNMPQSLAIQYARKEAMKAATSAGVIAGGLTEGVVTGGMNGVQVEQTLNEIDEETLMGYAPYREMRDQGLAHEVARAKISRDQGFAVALATAAVTGITGAPLNAWIAKWATRTAPVASRAATAAKGVAAEGAQEFVQEGSEGVLSNLGEQPVTGKGTWEGVLEQAITGAIVGGGIGGVVGGAVGSNKPGDAMDPTTQHRAEYDRTKAVLEQTEEAAADPSIRIAKADVDAAREEHQQSMIALGQSMLNSGKLDAKQQQAFAQALQQAEAVGVKPKVAPATIKGEVNDDGSNSVPDADKPAAPAKAGSEAKGTDTLTEVEVARKDALNRIATADSIEPAELNGLIAEKLARANSTGRPLLTPAGRRQLKGLADREAAIEAAKTAEKKSAVAAKKPTAATEPAKPTASVAKKTLSVKPAKKAALAKQAEADLTEAAKTAVAKRKTSDTAPVAQGGVKPDKAQAKAFLNTADKVAADVAAVQKEQTFTKAEQARELNKQAERDATTGKAELQKNQQRAIRAQAEADLDEEATALAAQQGTPDTQMAGALKNAKAVAEQKGELNTLRAAQSGTATPEQVATLVESKHAKVGKDGKVKLLPAGRRRMVALKNAPLPTTARSRKEQQADARAAAGTASKKGVSARKSGKETTIFNDGEPVVVTDAQTAEDIVRETRKERRDTKPEPFVGTDRRKGAPRLPRDVEKADLQAILDGDPTESQLAIAAAAGHADKGTRRLTKAGAKRLQQLKEAPIGTTASVTATKANLKREFTKRDDAFWNIMETSAGSLFRDSGYSGTQCTGYACQILKKLGAKRVKVFGFGLDENPSSKVAQDSGGHDFAIVDDRFIVDPWLGEFSTPMGDGDFGNQQVFDLESKVDRDKIATLYGEQKTWVDMTAAVSETLRDSTSARRGPGEQRNIQKTRAEARQVAGQIRQELGVDIKIADYGQDLPQAIRDALDLPPSHIQGAYHRTADGSSEMWIVASAHESARDMYLTAIHEVVGHSGLRGVLGDSYTATMRLIRDSFPQEVRDAARKNNIDWTHADPDTRESLRNLAAEELVAYSSEVVLGKGAGSRERSTWDKVVAIVRAALRKVGLLKRMDAQEITDLILRARDYVRNGQSKRLAAQLKYEGEVAMARERETDDAINFHHFSNLSEPEVTLDPAKMGTGIRGRESVRKPMPQISLYSEDVFAKDAEEGLRDKTMYVVRVNRDVLYDASTDPLQLKAKAQVPVGWAEEDGVRTPSQYAFSQNEFEKLVVENGYDGFITPMASGILKGQARLFKSYPAWKANPDGDGVAMRVSHAKGARLLGMPAKAEISGIGPVNVGPFEPAREASRKYREQMGLDSDEVDSYVRVNPKFAKRVADAFEEMKHAPNNTKVKAAYGAMIEETLAQWQAIKETGLKVEFITGEDPYAASPRMAIEDVKNNNHLWVYPTDAGFGGATYPWDSKWKSAALEKADREFARPHQGVEGVHVVPIEAISPNQDINDEKKITSYASEMAQGTKFPPIIVDSVGQIMDGHHRYFAAKKRGIKEIPVIEIYDFKKGPQLAKLLAESPVVAEADYTKDNPMLQPTSEKIGGRTLLANDVFRIVHDYFGHIQEGNGFRADGEENAWRIHASMYSPLARAAMTTETRGQNSWLNFGPHGEKNRSAKSTETVYAPQKIGLLPKEFWEDPSEVLSPKKQAAQKTIRKLAQYLTKAERRKLNTATSKKLVKLFDQLPDSHEMAAVALAGQAKRGWYRKSAEAISNIFGPDAPRFAALLAALSPQSSVEVNLENTVRVWAGWVNAGRPTDRKAILKVMGQNVLGLKGENSVLGAWKNNSLSALSDPNPEDLVLSGPKVDSFMRNLRGEVNSVTLDTWMANYALVEQKIFAGSGKSAIDPGKGVGYLAYSARVRQTAEHLSQMTGETWTPAEVQETVWSWAKALYEEVSGLGGIATARDIIESEELTDALINSTPDFATLFHNSAHERILREAGYGPQLDELTGTDDSSGDASKKTAPLAGDRERLLTAAERLDKLRVLRDGEPKKEADIAFSILGSNTGNPALDSFLEKVGGPKRTLKQAWNDFKTDLADKLALGIFDQFHGIKRAENLAGISAADSGYISARLSGNSAELTQAMAEYGHPIWNGGAPDVAGNQGLLDILKPLGDNVNLWLAYVVAKRADRLMSEGRENLFERNEINAALDLARQHPEFVVVAKRYAEFQKKVLDFAEEAGIINPESRALWENADYVPFYRVVENGEVAGSASAGTLGKIRNQIVQLRGGDTNIGDPLENILKNWLSLTDASLKAVAARQTVDNLNGTGLVTRAPQFEFKQVLVPATEVKKFIKANAQLVQTLQAFGVDVNKLPPAAFQGLQQMLAVQAPTDPDVISVWRGGKREYWKVHDELLFQSLQGINKKAWGPLMEIFRFPKRLLTATVTSTPQFAVKNLWRDMWHAFVQGYGPGLKQTTIPGLDTIKGTVSQLRMDAASQSMLAGGGSFTHGYVRAGDIEGSAATLRRTIRKKTVGGTILNSPATLWGFYRDLLNASENSGRVAIYNRSLATGVTRKEALYASRDMLDFSMRGANPVIQFLTESVPFMNARLQGMYRLGRGFKENFAAIAIRGLLITAASVAIFARNQDDEEYKALTDDQKNSYWHFFNVFEKGDHWKLPKPFEVGTLFGSIPEAFLDAFVANADEPDAASQSIKTIGHAFANTLDMSPKIQTIMPILELAINRSTFTGAPVLNLGDKGVLPEDQDGPGVKSTYRALAHAMPEFAPDALRSPKQLQHLGRGYLGSIQDYVLLVTDEAIRRARGEPSPPERASDDWPGLRDFRTTGPAKNTRYLNELYNIADEAEKISRSLKRNEEKGSDEGDARVEKLEATKAPYLDVRKDFSKAADEINDLRQLQRQTQLDKDMSPADKRIEINSIQEDINDIARELWDLRPGGKLNPEVGAELIGKDTKTQVGILQANGLNATAKLLRLA